jgi:hypothetical protein
MTEKTSSYKSFRDHIPQEAREHMYAAREEMRRSIEILFPEGFIKHRRAARKEVLMAWRSMIDAALERMEEGSK